MEFYLVVIHLAVAGVVLWMAAYSMRDRRTPETRDKDFAWAFRVRKIKGGK